MEMMISYADTFSIQLSNHGLGPWSWSVVDRDGVIVSDGQSERQDEARRQAVVTAQSLDAFRRVTGAW